MHLTRMFLNPVRRGSRRLLSSPQRLHAAVMASFPPGSDLTQGDGRVLWRVDAGKHEVSLFISSPTAPDLTALVEEAGWPGSPTRTWETASLDPLFARLQVGQRWRFRLTANPVYNKSVPGARGKRLGHVTVAQQEQWLQQRASSWGFSAPDAQIAERRQLSFPRRTDGSERTVTISTATFDGLLHVTDADLLRQSLSHGVGRAKAYGCGLITLAPTP